MYKFLTTFFRQPFICVTDLVIGSYPDIVEPYPAGPNVTIVISSPDVAIQVPPKCCTAALPTIIEVTPGPKPGKEGGYGQPPTIETPIVIFFIYRMCKI